MSPGWISAIVAVIVCLIAIGCHAIAVAWWASRITTTLNSLSTQLEKFATRYDKQLEKYIDERYTKDHAKEDFAKRDELIATMWKKHDTLRDEIAVLRSRIDNHVARTESRGSHERE